MITQNASGGDDGTVPVACALTPADLAAQGARWERLAARCRRDRPGPVSRAGRCRAAGW